MGITRLVPGRDCEGCTVCCVVPAIDDPELQKKAGLRCPHCDQGCRIYLERPKSCRDFYCAWRMIPSLDASWRPDRSGVLSWFENTMIDGKAVRTLTLMLIRNAEDILSNPGFLNFVGENVRIGQHTFLARPGWDRYRPLRVTLNSPQMSAAAQEGVASIRRILTAAWHFLLSQKPQLYEFQHQPNGSL